MNLEMPQPRHPLPTPGAGAGLTQACTHTSTGKLFALFLKNYKTRAKRCSPYRPSHYLNAPSHNQKMTWGRGTALVFFPSLVSLAPVSSVGSGTASVLSLPPPEHLVQCVLRMLEELNRLLGITDLHACSLGLFGYGEVHYKASGTGKNFGEMAIFTTLRSLPHQSHLTVSSFQPSHSPPRLLVNWTKPPALPGADPGSPALH